jgi:hypothetical protein
LWERRRARMAGRAMPMKCVASSLSREPKYISERKRQSLPILNKLKDKFSLYERATRKMKLRHHYRSSMISKISKNGTLVRDNRLSLSSLARSENINVMEHMTT